MSVWLLMADRCASRVLVRVVSWPLSLLLLTRSSGLALAVIVPLYGLDGPVKLSGSLSPVDFIGCACRADPSPDLELHPSWDRTCSCCSCCCCCCCGKCACRVLDPHIPPINPVRNDCITLIDQFVRSISSTSPLSLLFLILNTDSPHTTLDLQPPPPPCSSISSSLSSLSSSNG